MRNARTPKKTSVLATAIATPRPGPERGVAVLRIRDRRSPSRVKSSLQNERPCRTIILREALT